jgi:multidrug efflux pump subunit AcrA (membrane-fusion protein)
VFQNTRHRLGVFDWRVIAVLISLAALVGAYAWTRGPHSPPPNANKTATHAEAPDPHAHGDEHAHDHDAHSDPNHLDLSPQAQRNIGLKVGPVTLQTFERVVTIPGIVVERPGRTSAAVTAPLTGVIEKIEAIEGEAVSPGEPLFTIRLTHEEIVQAQGDFLKTAVELEVIRREVERLDRIVATGAIAGKTLRDRKYEQEKMESALQAQREALLLHGLSEDQVDAIAKNQKLLQRLEVFAPTAKQSKSDGGESLTWQVQELRVAPGQHVNAGDTLAVLTDYQSLAIEGKAFEHDTRDIYRAIDQGWSVTAVIESSGRKPEKITGLKLTYAAGRVDRESRAFHFYVALPNRLLRDAKNEDGRRFIDWQFKPGQRVELRVPAEQWKDRIVLPVDAVAREGPESYIFQQSGDAFFRRPVYEEYRDQYSVVIANDGSIFPGDQVALTAAQQMQIAIKNKSGGAIDPHAGHQH